MNKERLFRVIGQVDDRVIERYHEIDTRLSRKQAVRKRATRILTAVACVVLVLVACLPLAALAHPAGRAVLQGDSVALTEYLVGIDGFAAWQDQTAEKLEQSLPRPLWELMQNTPVLDVLTRSQYPSYTMKGATFGAYVEQPFAHVYHLNDPGNHFAEVESMIDVSTRKYRDESAPEKFVFEMDDAVYELGYAYSETQGLTRQAIHAYQLYTEVGEYVAYLDAQTLACIYWSSPKREEADPENGLTFEAAAGIAYELLSEKVRDPEKYDMIPYSSDKNSAVSYAPPEVGTYVVEYNRMMQGPYTRHSDDASDVLHVSSCDRAIFAFDAKGNLISFDLRYLGALRYADRTIPQELLDYVLDYHRHKPGDYSSVTDHLVVILPDGRLALTSDGKFTFGTDGASARYAFLTYLTEPIEENEGYGIIEPDQVAGKYVLLSKTVDGATITRIEYEYDAKGRVQCEIWYTDSKEDFRVMYTYTSDGLVAQKQTVHREWEFANGYVLYEYDLAGLLICESHYDVLDTPTDKILYEYDEQGHMIKKDGWTSDSIYTYGENGSYVAITESIDGRSSKIEFVYDDKGNQTHYRSYLSESDEVFYEIVYEYDLQNRPTKLSRYNYGVRSTYMTWNYPDLTSETVTAYQNGEVTYYLVKQYNAFGDLLCEQELDPWGNITQTTVYEYGLPNQSGK